MEESNKRQFFAEGFYPRSDFSGTTQTIARRDQSCLDDIPLLPPKVSYATYLAGEMS